jgi:hypothetical protein
MSFGFLGIQMVLPFKMLMPAEFSNFLQMYMNYPGFDNCPLMGLIVQPIIGHYSDKRGEIRKKKTFL